MSASRQENGGIGESGASAGAGVRAAALDKLIVLTDLHMVPVGRRIVGLDPHERLRRAVAHINRHHADAVRVICTGDLADRGDTESYLRLKELLGQLNVPVSLLIGNHDHRERFLQVFTQSPQDAHGFVQQTIDLPAGGANARLVLLDTVMGPPYVFPDGHSGYLCQRRLDWLKRQLESAGERSVLVFMHHPPHPTGFAGMDAMALRNGAAFYEVLRRHSNVRHIVAGHVHRTISGSCQGIGFSVFKSTCHQQPMDFETMDTSLSVNEPAAYGILFLGPDAVLVHTEDYELSQEPQSSQRAAQVA
jgi:3',5'-cyclic AMP phosphodiesterase CpdA